MMKKEEEKTTEEDLKHRRRGGAFDDFARILRKINKMIFNTGTTLNDRPGIKSAGGYVSSNTVPSDSVFEIFQNEPKKGTFNFITFGKTGDRQKLNTNYIDLCANSRSDENSPGNGQVGLKLTKDGDKDAYKYSKISLYEAGNYTKEGLLGSGARAEVTGEGAGGGVQLTYIAQDGNIYGFILDADGIQLNKYNSSGSVVEGLTIKNGEFTLTGLPTSAPSGSNKLYKSSNYVRITT